MIRIDIKTVEKYLSGITSDKFHRYKSWDHCFETFKADMPTKYHCLELAFYLASWGMYRGSSGLLQKNHLIHDKAVEIIYSDKYQQLKCTERKEVTSSDIELILELKKELGSHYRSFEFKRGGKEKRISNTDTLISKILLGTLGCVPAYDQYFIEGMKKKQMSHFKFNKKSLEELFGFIRVNNEQINFLQGSTKQKLQTYYPTMKIIDMYFWQLGFDMR